MSILIDCESLQTALHSLCSLFCCSEKRIKGKLLKIDLDRVYEKDEPNCTPDHFLYRNLESTFGTPRQPDAVCWFHLTRTFRTNKFIEGILPLGMALDSIWDTILSIFSKTDHYSRLKDMRMEGISNYHYKLKVPNPLLWGPFAMLVRDVAFSPEKMANHDYLRLPEIIEDICNDYLDRYQVSIHQDIIDALVPCIVKFVVHENSGVWCIAPAIYYVYRGIRGKSVCLDANTCFDGRGNLIPRTNILQIDYIEKP